MNSTMIKQVTGATVLAITCAVTIGYLFKDPTQHLSPYYATVLVKMEASSLPLNKIMHSSSIVYTEEGHITKHYVYTSNGERYKTIINLSTESVTTEKFYD